MSQTVESPEKIGKVLKELVRLDYDAIEAYEEAIEKLDDPRLKEKLAEFCQDHRRHTENLAPYLRALGEEVPTGPDLKRILTEGKVVIASLLGDKAIMIAMRANEGVTNTAYDAAVSHVDAGEDLRTTLRANLADEQRHKAWIEQAIAEL